MAQEAHALLGDVETVAVKRGFGRFHARCLHPRRAQLMIKEGAKRAVKRCKEIKPYVVAPPIEIKLEVATTDLADALADHDDVRRIDARTIVKVVSSSLQVIDF